MVGRSLMAVARVRGAAGLLSLLMGEYSLKGSGLGRSIVCWPSFWPASFERRESRPERSGVHLSLDPVATMARAERKAETAWFPESGSCCRRARARGCGFPVFALARRLRGGFALPVFVVFGFHGADFLEPEPFCEARFAHFVNVADVRGAGAFCLCVLFHAVFFGRGDRAEL